MRFFSRPSWLNRSVVGFGLTSFFSDLSHEVATTLLPLLLRNLGAPAYAVGLIEGLADSLANFGRILGGWLSDRIGKRKNLALAGYFLTSISQGLFAFVSFWQQALWIRVIGWFGRGWRSPIRDALFHDSVEKEVSGRAFGFERMMDTLGAVIAPVLVFFFLNKVGFKNLFILTWIPGAIAIVSFAYLVKEKTVSNQQIFSLLHGFSRFQPQYKKFLLAVTMFGLGDFSHTLLIYWAGVVLTPVYGEAKAASTAIVLYAVHNIIYALVSYPMGHLGDKFGKIRVLGFGYGLACLMFLSLIFSQPTFVHLLVIFSLGGFYYGIQDALERAIAGDLLSCEIKGTGYGALASLNGIGDLLSSFIVGLLLSSGSSAIAFGYCAVMGTAGTILLSRCAEKDADKSIA